MRHYSRPRRRVRNYGSLGALETVASTNAYTDIPRPPPAPAPSTPAPTGACATGYERNAYGYCVPKQAASPTVGSGIADALKYLFGGGAAQPQMPMYMPQQSGMSTTTMLIGGAAVIGVIAIIATRK